MTPVEERFWSKVDASGDCWEWTAHVRATGYATYPIWNAGRVLTPYVHVFAYRCLVGEIPKGLDLDHLCRNPRCVNPDHLEPVTHRENLRRSPVTAMGRTHCSNGHPFDEANTGWFLKGGTAPRRYCRICQRARIAAFRRRARALKHTASNQEAPPAASA